MSNKNERNKKKLSNCETWLVIISLITSLINLISAILNLHK